MPETLTHKNTSESLKLFERACNVIPGGVNSPVRSFKSVESNPLFISKAKDAFIWDVDNNKYIDFVNSWGALIHGHAHEKVIIEIEKALAKGTSYGAPHENELELCELIVQSVPSIEKVRLVNSGTEAVMTALRLAKAYTKRNKIVKFSGCYHGHSDSVLSMSGSGFATFGIPSSPGVSKNTANETITLPYNELFSLELILNKYPNDIAAIIVEPVMANAGVIPPIKGYLESLRTIANKFHCLLIFDEVITGFRLSKGGAQEKFNVMPDLTTLGKIIGGGMPIGAVGGKKEIMDLLAPIGSVYQAGTLSGNPISVACGLATLKLIDKNTYTYLEETTNELCEEVSKLNDKSGANLTLNKTGSMFSLFFTKERVTSFEKAKLSNTKSFAQFFKLMLLNGIYLAPSQFEANFLSTAFSKEELTKTIEAYKNSITEMFK